MLFRPSYCCKCGQPIEREEWRLWTSRRFCDLCATDHFLLENVTRFIVGLGCLVLVVGTANYMFGGRSRKELSLTRAPVMAQNVEPQKIPPQNVQEPMPVQTSSTPQTETTATMPRTLAALPGKAPQPPQVTEAVAQSYYCGAETKKGTPCSRKVKGNVRCWQHTGMPAMLPPDKLLVSR